MERTREPRPFSAPVCCEPGCDRAPLAADQRCALHSSRLGPLVADGVVLQPVADVERHDGPVVVALPIPRRHPALWTVAAAASLATAVAAVADLVFSDLHLAPPSAPLLPLRVVLALACLVGGPYSGVRAVREARHPLAQLGAGLVGLLASVPALLAFVGLVAGGALLIGSLFR